MKTMRILITGGRGLVGSALTRFFEARGHEVRLLSRAMTDDARSYHWDVAAGKLDHQALVGIDAIFHLAGASVMEGRWTRKRKKEITNSRVRSTRLLLEVLASLQSQPSLLIAASAIGYYGVQPYEHLSSEEDAPAQDFLAEVCRQWEHAADGFAPRMRVVKLRIGVVLAREGGALPKMLLPVKLGLGAALGSGCQYLNWIHIMDLVSIFQWALDHPDVKGVYNAVSTHPQTNQAFTRSLARVLHKPLWLPNTPALLLRSMLGERADLVLEGHRVSNAKLIESGFAFQYDTSERALTDLLGQP